MLQTDMLCGDIHTPHSIFSYLLQKGLRGAASLRRYCSMLEHFTDVDKLIDAVYRLQE